MPCGLSVHRGSPRRGWGQTLGRATPRRNRHPSGSASKTAEGLQLLLDPGSAWRARRRPSWAVMFLSRNKFTETSWLLPDRWPTARCLKSGPARSASVCSPPPSQPPTCGKLLATAARAPIEAGAFRRPQVQQASVRCKSLHSQTISAKERLPFGHRRSSPHDHDLRLWPDREPHRRSESVHRWTHRG